MLRMLVEPIPHPGMPPGEGAAPMDAGMMIRRADRDADCEGISLIFDSLESEPVTPAEVGKWFDHRPPGKVTARMVAVDGEDRVVGYAVVDHDAWRPVGDFFAWIGVLPEWQRRGVGSALSIEVEACLASLSPAVVRSDIREANQGALEFAMSRGFSVQKRICESVLDIEGFDDALLAGCRTGLEAEGFSFLSMADLPGCRESQHRVYDLNRQICLEIPGEEEDAGISFDEWTDLLIGAPWFRADGQLLCAFGGELVGLAAVQVFPGKREAYNLVTGVIRPFRRRGVATALKLEAVRYARANGAIRLRANNESGNEAILRVNRRFGYTQVPGRLMVQRTGA
jgi:GNAT superfamily N-acetyltransferase